MTSNASKKEIRKETFELGNMLRKSQKLVCLTSKLGQRFTEREKLKQQRLNWTRVIFSPLQGLKKKSY